MNPIEKYFTAEKNESILFFFAGVVAIVLSVYFLVKIKQPYFSGMAYALITIGLIQIVVGGSVYLRSPKDVARVNILMQTDRAKIAKEEIPRMHTVLKNFVAYRWVEIALVMIGIFLFLYFPPATLLKGVGLGFIIQSGLMLVLDLFAESRGKIYLEFLQQLN